jgi:hypothetical protein
MHRSRQCTPDPSKHDAGHDVQRASNLQWLSARATASGSATSLPRKRSRYNSPSSSCAHETRRRVSSNAPGLASVRANESTQSQPRRPSQRAAHDGPSSWYMRRQPACSKAAGSITSWQASRLRSGSRHAGTPWAKASVLDAQIARLSASLVHPCVCSST